MNTIILCAAIGLVIGLIFAFRGKRESSKYAFFAISGPAIGAVVGLFVAMGVIGSMVPMKEVVYGPGQLVAMRSSDGISGTFVWGSGSISNQTTYNFLKRMEDGSMVPDSVPATGRVHLIEDPSLKDSGFYTIKMRVVDRTSPLFNWALQTSFHADSERYEFRVPVGTIVQKFTID